MSQEEIAATQECIKYAVMLRKGGLSREEKADLEEGFEKAKKVLLEIRQERYDSEGNATGTGVPIGTGRCRVCKPQIPCLFRRSCRSHKFRK